MCTALPPTEHRFSALSWVLWNISTASVPSRFYRVASAFVPLTFDLDCYILFSEHGLTSFLLVSQLQLEVILAPFVYPVSVNPSTFREEPKKHII